MATPALEPPNPTLQAAEAQWLFTEEELRMTPSIEDGWTVEQERECRAKGVNFIASVGIMLRVPQLTLATASVFLHRFYCRHSMNETKGGFHYYSMAATALFLATKVEENCRRIKELVVACCRIAQKNPNLKVDDQSREYWRWRDTILVHEDILLEALCFDMTLRAPHSIFFEMLVALGEQDNKRVRNAAWAFCNDSLLTVHCLMYPPTVIAGASIYFAGKVAGYEFRETDGQKWWKAVGCDFRDMKRALNFMADFYEQFPSRKQTTNEYSNTPVSNSPAAEEGLLTPARTSGESNPSQSKGDSGEKIRTSAGEASPASDERRPLKRRIEDNNNPSVLVVEGRPLEKRPGPASNEDEGQRETKRQRTVEPEGNGNSLERSKRDTGSEDGEVT
ncbi:MAG: hypothetical protein M1814_006677 [Vezdaea aestivalis]|nr:MAG: hypothetical protein M1814_006677 [Vezdaea aestivalis]